MLAGRFIVGTGRCGSTLLSRMLSCHPDVLSLHEFFAGLDWGKRFQREPVGGDAFCELICAPNPILTMVLERGCSPVEVTYPFERHGARFSPTEPLPYLLAHTLPPLAADPDQPLPPMLQLIEINCCAPVTSDPVSDARVTAGLNSASNQVVVSIVEARRR